MNECTVPHAKEALLDAILAHLRTHFKDLTPEVVAGLSDKHLLLVLESDELEVESEMQIFNIVHERATALCFQQKPEEAERLLKVRTFDPVFPALVTHHHWCSAKATSSSRQ